MAYRCISPNFWSDPKVDDDFTPEDKYFYLYLLTNPHTTLSGCYELGKRQACRELGYNEDTVDRLIHRMEYLHKVIRYDKTTKEVLILNWHKYNWSKSPKCLKGVEYTLKDIKSEAFRKYCVDTLSIRYQYPMDTTVSVSVPVTVSETVSEYKVSDINYKSSSSKEDSSCETTMTTDSLVRDFRTHIGNLSERAKTELAGYAERLGEDLVREIIHKCSDTGGHSWVYVRKALLEAETQGIKTVEEYRLTHPSGAGLNQRVDRKPFSGNDWLRNASPEQSLRRLKKLKKENNDEPV